MRECRMRNERMCICMRVCVRAYHFHVASLFARSLVRVLPMLALALESHGIDKHRRVLVAMTPGRDTRGHTE